MNFDEEIIKPTKVDNKIIPYRRIQPEDTVITAVDRRKNLQRALLPMICGIVCAILAAVTPFECLKRDMGLPFMWALTGICILMAVILLITGIRRINPAKGICEAIVENKRKDEYRDPEVNNGTSVWSYFLKLKVPDAQVAFEAQVDDIDYHNATVGGKAYILKTGKKTYRIAVMPPEVEK